MEKIKPTCKVGDTIRFFTGYMNRKYHMGVVSATGDDAILNDVEIHATVGDEWGTNEYRYLSYNQVLGVLEEELKSLVELGSM